MAQLIKIQQFANTIIKTRSFCANVGVATANGGMKGAKHQNHLEFLKYATCSIISALGLYTDYTSKQTMVYLENETELKEVILNWESYTHDIDFAGPHLFSA